jgi:hypothetical protein
MNDRWIAVAPLSAEAALRAIAEAACPLRKEWSWAFHGGKTYGFDSARGASLYLAHQTSFGHVVVMVENDREGLVDRITQSAPVEDMARLSRRAEDAASDIEKLGALNALASAQGMAGSVALPAFEQAVRRALDDASSIVRLAGIRASAILPVANALSLLEGREDPENPGLADWREHFRGVLERQSQ